MSLLARWAGRAIKLTDGGFWKGYFGLGSDSGEMVTVDRALQLDAAWACIKLLAETVGTLPLMVYERGANGDTAATTHPLYELLHYQPNIDDTAVEFWEGVVLSLMLYGNAYAEKRMNGARLVGLIPLDACTVKVERNERNERVYHVSDEGRTRKLSEDRIFHVRGLKLPGCDLGLSPIAYARQTLGNAIAAEKTAGKMFAGGLQVAGVLSTEQFLKPEQRKELQTILERYAGSDKVGKIMVLEGGQEYKQLSLNPEDAQMLQTRQFGIEQVCRWFGVPPIMIGHAAQGQTMWGSGVEQLVLQFAKTGLRPILRRIEAEVRRDILTPAERMGMKVEFNMEGLLRGDSASRAQFYSTMAQNGILTRNEIRKLENRPPQDGGDELTAQTNLAPLAKLGEVGRGGQVESGVSALVEASVERALKSTPPQTR